MYTKTWEQKQIKAASLLALGASSTQVCQECDMTQSQFRYLKKLPEFRRLVDDTKARLKETVQQQVADSLGSDISGFRLDYKKVSDRLLSASNKLMEKVEAYIEKLDLNDISPAKIPSILRVASDVYTSAFTIKKAVLGIDELMEYTDEFRAITQARIMEASITESTDSAITPVSERRE